MRPSILAAFALLLAASPLVALDFSYVLLHGKNDTLISGGGLEEAIRVSERFPGQTLIWARFGGHEYVIRDASVLARIETAFKPLRALSAEQQRLQIRMRPVENRVDRLEDEADALTDLERELTRDEERRLREIDLALEKLHPELRALSHEERRLDEKEEALEEIFDAEVERLVRQAVRDGKGRRI